MKKSEFLRRLLSSVKGYKKSSHLDSRSLWQVAEEAVIKAGFAVDASDGVEKNKITVAVKRLGGFPVSGSEGVLVDMIFIEEAWEYYEENLRNGTEVTRAYHEGIRKNL